MARHAPAAGPILNDATVVVGAGHAAGHLASALVSGNAEGALVLIGSEPYLPYQRPPLSKQFLAGEYEQDRLLVHPGDFYAQHRVEVVTGVPVESIDRDARRVRLLDGRTVGYGKLVLATGSRPRRLAVPGSDLGNVFSLRTIDDSLALRAGFTPGARLVIVGGGYIGLETAAVAIRQGLEVTVLETMPRLLSRVVSEPMASFYRAEHEAAGVRVVTGTQVTALRGNGAVSTVECADGSTHGADMVLVAIGAVPNTDLAEVAGLEVDDGIVVDGRCRTSDENVYAIGDCTRHPNALLNRPVRLESVQNASAQARVAAANLGGRPSYYREIPTFWSDQFDLKLQMVGLFSEDGSTVVRGDAGDRAFSVFHLREGRVIAAECVNRAPDFVLARQLIAKGLAVNPHDLADTAVSGRELLAPPA